MKTNSGKRNKRTILELCLPVLCAVFTLAASAVWLKSTGFGHIREVAAADGGGFAVFEESGSHYIFYVFDAENRVAGKMAEAKEIAGGGPAVDYSGMAVYNGEIYLQRKAFSDDGELVRESIVKKTPRGTVEIFDSSYGSDGGRRFLTGDLSVHDGKLFFMRQDAGLLSLLCYDESGGVSEIAEISLYGLGWNYVPAYIGNGNIVFADDDSVIRSVNVLEPEIMTEVERAGAVQSLAAGDGSFAYFDLYLGEIVLNTPDGGIIRHSTDRLLSSDLCLQSGSVMAIELDAERNGRSIVSFNMKIEQLIKITPDWFTPAGMFAPLLNALYALLIYAALRLWLYLLVERHLPLILRVVLVAAPLAVCCSVAFYYISYPQVYLQTASVQEKNLKVLIEKGDKIERIKAMALECGLDTPTGGEAYEAMTQELFELTGVERNSPPHRTLMYYGIVAVRGSEYHSLCFSYPFGKFQKKGDMRYLYKDTALDVLRLCAVQGEEGYFTAQGEHVFYFYQTPIINGNGEIAAVLEIGIDLNMIKTNAQVIAGRQTIGVVLIAAAITGVFIGVLSVMLRSLGVLKSGVERITRGESNVLIRVRTKDELGDIADAFNLMSAYVDQKTQDGQSFHRFVPEEISAILGRGVAAAALGDYTALKLSVLCLGISEFYSAKASPDLERLSFCYNNIAKIVRREKGYMRQMDAGRGFSLFFAPALALEAAVEICGRLRGHGVRAAIDYGGVTVAVLGDDARLQTAAVSGIMERTRVLQDIARALGSNILLTHEAFGALEVPDIYRYRFLGTVAAGEYTMKLYDIFEADEEAVLDMKGAALNDFNAGVELFYEGRRTKARDRFVRALKAFPEDNVSRLYLSLCEEDGKNCLKIDTERN